MLFFCINLILFAQSHNWIHSRSRAHSRASTLQPAPPKPSIRRPHIRVGQNQDFGFEWASGHTNSEFFFVILHGKHEDKLKEHTISNLKKYLDQAPQSSELKGDKWQKRHTSCGFSSMCKNKDGKNDGSAYLKQLNPGDALYFDRPSIWGDEGIAQFQYKSADLALDKRVSYTNKKFPWIEAVHHFKVKQGRPREWDIANFQIEGKEGPGEYLIHMVWRGYRDIIDVDVLPNDSNDIYGQPSESNAAWTRIDHCQYKSQNYVAKQKKCFYIKNTDRDVSKCLQECQKVNKKGKPKCNAVNVVPLKSPEGAFNDLVNVPWDQSTRCDELTASQNGDDSLVCYGLKPIVNNKDNPEVDSLWTVIENDPEDPIFYSTCYNYQQGWVFQDYLEGSGAPQARPISEKVGDQCLACSDIEKINGLKVSQAPLWRLAQECSKCTSYDA